MYTGTKVEKNPAMTPVKNLAIINKGVECKSYINIIKIARISVIINSFLLR